MLKAIYEERGYRTRDIPKLILENNLFGLDIDDRAAQLAGFALLMKAREDDRRILTRLVDNKVRLNVLAMQSSQHLDANTLWRDLNLTGDWHQGQSQSLFDSEQQDLASNNATYKLIADLIERFQDAKTFGSLIEVPNEREVPLKALLEELSELTNSGDMMQKAAAQRLVPVVQQAWVLAQRYDALVANPPYMGSKGMNKALKDYAKNAYPNSKSDLFAIFMEHAFSLLAPQGYNAQINMQSWMFLSSYEKLRDWLLDNTTIITMAHLGGRAFDSISGEVVSATAFVMEKIAKPDYQGAYLRLVDGKSEADKQGALLEAIQNRDCGWFYEAKPDDFKKIPGSPVAYWLTRKMLNIFESSNLLGEMAEVKHGLSTGKNEAVVRFWPEISWSEFGRGFESRSEALVSKYKWFPYNKGGDYRKWYGNCEYVLRYDEYGNSLMASFSGHRHDGKSHYFREGVTWTFISSSNFAARYTPPGFVFDVSGSSLFLDTPKEITAFLCSNLCYSMLKALNPTLNFQVGNLKSLPVMEKENNYFKDSIKEASEHAIEISRRDWDGYETSWDFKELPLLEIAEGKTAQESFSLLKDKHNKTVQKMREIELESNRLYNELYGLKEDVTPEVSLEEITLTCNPSYRYGIKHERELETLLQCDTFKELISYSIGCMMGRYSLDKPGLILASQGETVRDYLAQVPEPSFIRSGSPTTPPTASAISCVLCGVKSTCKKTSTSSRKASACMPSSPRREKRRWKPSAATSVPSSSKTTCAPTKNAPSTGCSVQASRKHSSVWFTCTATTKAPSPRCAPTT